MAEGGFDSYFHVPNQSSRRDKLRVFMEQNTTHHNLLPSHHPGFNHFPNCSGLFPVYDPSICSNSELIHPSPNYYNSDLSLSAEGAGKLRSSSMGGLGVMINAVSSTSSSSPSTNYPNSHVNVLPSLFTNPSSVPITHNSFPYTSTHCNDEAVGYIPEAVSTTGKGLSLSLSSHNPHHRGHNTLPMGLDVRSYCGPAIYDDKVVTWSGEYVIGGSTNHESARSSLPSGPFTGYAAILKSSKFLKPAQQLLQELHIGICGDDGKSSIDLSLMDLPSDYCLRGVVENHSIGEERFNLMAMLEEVCKRYKQFYQQIQEVVASVEYVACIGNATPYVNLTMKALSKQFKSVKLTIADQLQGGNETLGVRVSIGQRSIQSTGFIEQRPVWRPQRGLPERAVSVLRAWLFEHFLHPYPTDTDKLMLAKQTGLSRNQVSNWFINARVRLWKPMVEEIHMLETRQASKIPRSSEPNMSGPKISSRNELPSMPVSGNASLSFDNFHGQPNQSGRVSLTLGLHQNNGLSSSEPPHRVGRDDAAEGYVMTGFEPQNRQYGRSTAGGQLFG